jgi:phosphoesterase RecJ-like protein
MAQTGFKMLVINDLKNFLQTRRNIIITTHLNPDADALGSSLGLGNYLRRKGHDVKVISPTDYPKFLQWMEGNKEVIIYHDDKKQIIDKWIQEADIIFCLDFNTLSRVAEMEEMIRKSNAKKVLIDHHLEPEHFANFEYSSIDAAATAELIYEIIVSMGDREIIDKGIAECLYAGIMTDTGQFKHNNVTQNVHFVTANLMALGADTARVGSLIYDNNSYERIKFLGYALYQKLIFLQEYCAAYIVVSARDQQKFHAQTGDTEGLVNYALSLNDVVLAALISERDDGIKLSFRSKGEFSVNEFARKHFNGGGHKNAAGGNSDLGLDETVIRFISILKEYREVLNNYKNETEN